MEKKVMNQGYFARKYLETVDRWLTQSYLLRR
jgi:hypothetical protein